MDAEVNGHASIEKLEPGTPFVEAYGLMLAGILLRGNGKPPAVVAVVACRAGDGATTTALNLALMMARTGRPTALVDGNLRQPELHKALGVSLMPGLAEVLTGKTPLQNATARTRVPDLSLVPAGEASASAQVLLSGPAMKGLLSGMRERFDLVILDTPPILQYPDALYVAKDVDGVVQVVAPGGSSRKDQQEMRRLLDMVGARVLGAVLNRVPTQEGTPTARVP